MTIRDNGERQFSEDIERMLRGEEPAGKQDDPVYTETMLFARRLIELREEPDPGFAGTLKRNLLTGMAAQDAQQKEPSSWFVRVFGSPALRLAVVSTFVVLAAVGLVWRAGLLSPTTPQAASEPPGMLTVPPSPQAPDLEGPSMARAGEDGSKEDASLAAGATVPASITVVGYAEPTAFAGDSIPILIVFRNQGPDGYSLNPFPPAITIRETATGRVVYTFAVGTSSCPLSAMTTLTYDLVWDQKDGRGLQVAPGHYEVDLEMVIARPEQEDLALATASYDVTEFDILARPVEGATGTDVAAD